jgi:hypothetical protein
VAEADRVEHLKAVHSRHDDVEQNRVEALRRNQTQRGCSVCRLDDLKAAPAEEAVKHVAVVGLIVNNEESRRGGVFCVHNSQIPTECGFSAAIQQIDAAITEVNGALTGERLDQIRDQIKRFWLVNFTPNAFTEAIPEGIVKEPI